MICKNSKDNFNYLLFNIDLEVAIEFDDILSI